MVRCKRALPLLLALLTGSCVLAQSPPPAVPGPAAGALDWVPAGAATLATEASTHTDFTFDRSMLEAAGALYGVDDATKQTIGRLNGIALHLYRFPAPNAYSQATVRAIRDQYDALGWKHFSTTKQSGDPMAEPTGHTDVWLQMHGINIAGVMILVSGPKAVSLIDVSGDLSTLDLLRLRGHFGIPRFPDDALPH